MNVYVITEPNGEPTWKVQVCDEVLGHRGITLDDYIAELVHGRKHDDFQIETIDLSDQAVYEAWRAAQM